MFRRSISDSVPSGLISIGPAGGIHFIDLNQVQRMAILADGSSQIIDGAGNVRLQVSADGDTYIYDNSSHLVFWSDVAGNFTRLRLPSATNNTIGVDATGAYKETAGVKTYL